LATILKEAEPASEKLPVLARQLDEVLQEIKHTVKSVGVIAEHNNERLDRLEPKIAAVTENLNMASRSFAESTLPSVNQTLLSLQKTAESLDTLVQNLTERPQSILYGRPKLRRDLEKQDFRHHEQNLCFFLIVLTGCATAKAPITLRFWSCSRNIGHLQTIAIDHTRSKPLGFSRNPLPSVA